MALMYCKKCGRLIQGGYDDNDESSYYCDCCNSITYRVPTEFLISDSVPIVKSELKQQFINEYIKTSPEFDQYLFDHRDEIVEEKSRPIRAALEKGKGTSNTPKCPYCGSTNISKIGTINRAVSVGLLGLASSKIGKTHKCNKCGSTW